MDFIKIEGARLNNLKNISLEIPKKKITIFTGVSGSGKSSIVFDTIANESARLLTETFPAFVRSFMPKYTRPEVDEIKNISPSIIIEQKRIGGNSRSTVGTITDIDPLLRVLFSRIASPHIGLASHFSFNDSFGMCQNCQGIGRSISLNIDKAIDFERSLNGGAILLPGYTVGGWQLKIYTGSGFFDNDKKIKDYNKSELDKLLYAKAEKIEASGELDFNLTYMGLVERFEVSNIKGARERSEKTQKKIEAFVKDIKCKECLGKRYNIKTLGSLINGYNIADLQAMQANELLEAIRNITDRTTETLVENLQKRVTDLMKIGLGYISLNRETSTLSGGESQRIKMIKNLSSSLTDMLYIFDEPSIGLHPHDVHLLCNILQELRDKGNTVIVVEHDPDVIKIADYIFDIGPYAGSKGGEIVFNGTLSDLTLSNTLTALYFNEASLINQNPRKFKETYNTKPSTLNNLKNISINIPKGIFTVITGVAGSGKSTLIHQVFAKEYAESIVIDQNAVGANSRSNSATYTGTMDYIRQEFAENLSEPASIFSFNSEGACPICNGAGVIETELAFMDAIKSTCEACDGSRYKKEVLDKRIKGKNIADVMNMTISDAIDFFTKKEIATKLKNLNEVGLGYLTLGQPLSTLSGGECQRLKLAKELSKKGNIYILDEPTTGLHFSDIKTIINIINKLVDKGNTVIAIEHNLSIIRSADWIIDLGPEAGLNGGEIIFEGEPAKLKANRKSITAKYI